MDLVSRVQRLPIGKFHYTLLWVIGLGWMFDAMDTGLISFILTKMAEEWQMTPTEKGRQLKRLSRFIQLNHVINVSIKIIQLFLLNKKRAAGKRLLRNSGRMHLKLINIM